MAQHFVDQIVVNGIDVDKQDWRDYAKQRLPVLVNSVAELQATDTGTSKLVYVLSATRDGVIFELDAADGTTADDGVNVIVSGDGKRFKRLAGLADLGGRAPIRLHTVAGTNTVTAAATPPITALRDGQPLLWLPVNDNTGAVTLDPGGGAKTVVDLDGAALTGGEIKAGRYALGIYDETANEIQLFGGGGGDFDGQMSTDLIMNDNDVVLGQGRVQGRTTDTYFEDIGDRFNFWLGGNIGMEVATGGVIPHNGITARRAGGSYPFKIERNDNHGPNQNVSQWEFVGRNDINQSIFISRYIARVVSNTDGSESARIAVQVMDAGVLLDRFYIEDGPYTPGATGGSQGVDTFNTGALYENGVAVSCSAIIAFEKGLQAADGKAYLDDKDLAYFDALAPERPVYGLVKADETGASPALDGEGNFIPHDGPMYELRDKVETRVTFELDEAGERVLDEHGRPIVEAIEEVLVGQEKFQIAIEQVVDWLPGRNEDMRKFRARLGTDTDPLDPQKFVDYYRIKRHPTMFPNPENYDRKKDGSVGSWINRFQEFIGIYTVHLMKVLKRFEDQQAEIDDLKQRLAALEGARGK